ncbi:serine hydrolase domain-containing protein [Wenzhouxiangella sediminis]|uniref:Class C beta-lactamase-related serine hydrolase n=1 Tax=Wenzhouxiangella sediminis TaxID=1792836 RepID=A0A3E1K838_9GAMM|nr:serine hydrolase [Wenzhouxiangella sediminis]RFF30189.1 class C beta-lactamase-related serine hydrolase [Wenzhouxiangella sediminis]
MNDDRHDCKPNIARLAAAILIVALCAAAPLHATAFTPEQRRAIVEQADALPRLYSLLVLHEGEPVIEHVRTGPDLDSPASLKSLSKTILSALAGIAIERGIVEGPDQPLVELLGDRVPRAVDPQVGEITLGHALALQTGLRSTSGRYYGAWVQSENWVAHALTRPMVDEPGGEMIYSTGSTHLAGAALVEASGSSLLKLARDWLGEPLDLRIPDWMRDPQGIHFGGNQMRMSPRALARFGEAYRLGGTVDGKRVVPESWIEASWTPRGRSPWSNDLYGYGWFIDRLSGVKAYYGRGYGGQALFVVPDAALTIVVISDPSPPSYGGYFDRIKRLAASIVETAG